tara:strand:+ start:322 stop:528 length:207 start_codon:yes stop_codon:yes gene_type:complete
MISISTGTTGTATNTFLSSGYVIEGSNTNVLVVFVQATHSNKKITSITIANEGISYLNFIPAIDLSFR